MAAIVLIAGGRALRAQSTAPARSARIVATFNDDSERFPLTRPVGIVRDARERIWVSELNEHALYVLDSTARPIGCVGRQGAGPGEFRQPCCASVDAKGRIWVRDGGNSRYVVFNASQAAPFATYAFVVQLATNSRGWTTNTVFDDAGHVIDAGSEMKTSATLRYVLDSSGKVLSKVSIPASATGISPVKLIPMKPPKGSLDKIARYLYPPFPGYQLTAMGAHGETAVAGTGAYHISWYAGNGTLLRRIARADQGPVATARERAREDSAMSADTKELGTTPAAHGFSVPARKPVLRNIWFDTDGQLWVELTVTSGASHRAHVYAPRGKIAFTAEWPSSVELDEHSWIRGDEAWAVAYDADGSPGIVRMKFSSR